MTVTRDKRESRIPRCTFLNLLDELDGRKVKILVRVVLEDFVDQNGLWRQCALQGTSRSIVKYLKCQGAVNRSMEDGQMGGAGQGQKVG